MLNIIPQAYFANCNAFKHEKIIVICVLKRSENVQRGQAIERTGGILVRMAYDLVPLQLFSVKCDPLISHPLFYPA
jgi:hypothetical protein